MPRLAIGRAAGAFGEDGTLRVHWLGDGPDALLRATTVWLAIDEDDAFPRRHVVNAAEQTTRNAITVKG